MADTPRDEAAAGGDDEAHDDDGARSPVEALREEFHELRDTIAGLVGGRGVDEGEGEGAGAGEAKPKAGRTAAAQEADVETFVRGIVGKLDDERHHKSEHERLAAASAPKEEAPAVLRRSTRLMWG